jgi:DNA polymerase-3 subunit alpha
MGFINLHAHDEMSLLDGAGTPKQRAEQAVKLGQDSLAITNHGNLCSAPTHIQACKEYGLKPILGMEAYFKPDRTKKDVEHKKAYHLILLAKNIDGWKNLMKLSTEGQLSGFYHKPCVDYELLKKLGNDIICSSACISGYLPMAIQNGDDHLARETIERHLEIFGEDNYFLELMPHDVPAQSLVNIKLANYALDYNLKLVATGDSHYPYEEWKDTQDIILMISTGQSTNKRIAKKEAGEDVYQIDVPLHMFSEDEMYEMFGTNHSNLTQQLVTDAINQSGKIADQIEEFDVDRSNKLPRVDNAEKELHAWCREGMERIDKVGDKVYEDRFEHEFKTLKDMGVVDYFVIVGRMVRWARDQKIRISSGRGSAAGSLICYLIKITTVDPIAHELLFERFLNPSRKGLPDIDLDFQADRRDEVKKWLADEYGSDRVCDIAAFATYGPRGALKDASRVLNVPFQEINLVTKVIPEAGDVGGAANVPPLTLLREEYGAIDKFAKKWPEAWKQALRIEGQTKGLSRHAGGVVVADKPITEYMPLMRGAKGEGVITQWSSRADADIISYINMLKIDILSLDGLTKQGYTVESIKRRLGIDIDLDTLPIASDPSAVDPEVMKLFQKGQTLGVFQFGGSQGITNFLRHTKPDRFEDLVAVNALYRPGPLEGGDAFKYGDLKNGKLPIVYWHELIKPYLEGTYGVMVFQEQMQQIAQALGDFSPSESDDMRKATSKVYRMGKVEAQKFMAGYKDQWIKGCKNHDLTEEQAADIWERLVAFGSYSFNRSHATSYSLAGYQDGWLKTYYPLDFYSSELTFDDEPQKIIREGRSRNITVSCPDINNSEAEFTILEDLLLYGLESVKQVGPVTMQEILEKRPFDSYDDFCDKVEKKKVDSQAKQNLLWAGAFDSFGMRDDLTVQEKRQQELAALTVALTGAGESLQYEKIIDERINTEDEIENALEGSGIVIGGELISIQRHTIKSGRNKGKEMAYASLAYKDNNYECTIFNKYWEKYSDLVVDGAVIMAHGRKGERGEILIDQMTTVEKLAKALENDV